MKKDFLNANCTEKLRKDKLFGISDNDKHKAYTDIANKKDWIATVVNEQKIGIQFTAIDKCMIYYTENGKEKESKGWIKGATEQLEATINFLAKNYEISKYRYKKACGVNSRKPQFRVLKNESAKRFFKKTGGFRLDIQAKIIIK